MHIKYFGEMSVLKIKIYDILGTLSDFKILLLAHTASNVISQCSVRNI